MERYLATPIKEMIERHPAVGSALEEFRIGCVPCSVGTCLLGDVVEIHNLQPEDESALMARIASIVAPGRQLRLPDAARSRPARSREVTLSPPMKRLVDEHTVIKRFIALVPELLARLDLETEAGRQAILDGVEFIRNYADRYHHAKEEDILFGYFDPELDILKAMREDHRRGRECVAGILAGVEVRDRSGVASSLQGYAGILSDHIRKEDEILYPWMDRNLSTRQVGEMFSRFREAEARFGDKPKNYESFVEAIENTLPAGSEEVSA